MTKKIIEADLEDLTYKLEGTLGDLRSKVDRLIQKWGPDASLSIEIEREYDSEYVRVTVRGNREETDKEYSTRLVAEARQKEWQDKRDRAEWERLKAKFKE